MRDCRLRGKHPMNASRSMVPPVHTLLSPPLEVKWPNCVPNTPGTSFVSGTASVETISNHFNGMASSETTLLMNYFGCAVCGKSAMQIQNKTGTDYINKTAIAGEVPAQIEARMMGHYVLCQEDSRRRSLAIEIGGL